MTATLAGNSVLQSISLGTFLNNAATGAITASATFSVPVLTGSSSYPVVADLWIVLGGPFKTGYSTTAPYIQVSILGSDDGTNFEASFLVNNQMYPYWGGTTKQLNTANYTSGQVICARGLYLPWPAGSSNSFKVLVNNQTGGNFASSGNTATLYVGGGSIG